MAIVALCIMEKSFEERKREYLKKIEIEYCPPLKKSKWAKPFPVYKELWQHARKYKGPELFDELIVIRKSQNWLFVPVLILVTFLFNLIEWPDVSWFKALLTLLWFTILVIVVNLVKKLPSRKPALKIDANGILLMDRNENIKWHNLLRADVKEVDENDFTSFSILLQAYDETHDYFRAFEINVSTLNVSIEALSFYIEHCSGFQKT